jgi:hypothetical protein
MDTADVVTMLADSGFVSSVLPGYFDSDGKPHKRVIKELLNLVINGLGGYRLAAAPYYVLYGSQRSAT